MNKIYQSLLFVFITLVFVLGLTQKVSAVSCDSSAASWNQDWTDGSNNKTLAVKFGCQWMDDASGSNDRAKYTFIVQRSISPACNCTGSSSGKTCRCVRLADCVSLGGICLNKENQKTEVKKALSEGKIEVRFRCPALNETTCYRKTPPPPTPPPPVLIPIITTTTVEEDHPSVNISDCCRQIVPDDAAYENGNYGLNHFVQVAINVYECILCMVAALMLLMFVLGSFMFMTSAGNQSRVDQGKKILIGAVIGGIIVFASILIVNFSVKALGGTFKDNASLNINPGR